MHDVALGAGQADVSQTRSSSLRTDVNDVVTRFGPGDHGETGFPAGSTSRAPQSLAVLESFCGSGGPAPRAIMTTGHGVHPHSRSASPGLPLGRMASRGVPMCLRSHSSAYHSALRYRIQLSIGLNCSNPVTEPNSSRSPGM
jgi:hypothetical protein